MDRTLPLLDEDGGKSCSALKGLQAQRVLEAAIRCARTRRPVAIAEVK